MARRRSDPGVPDAIDPQDETTDVHATPMEKIERRTKNAATDARETLTTLTLMRDELQGARNELKTSVTRDEAEHKLLHAGLDSVSRQQQQTDEKVDTLHQQLNDMRVETANAFGDLRADTSAANGKLEILIEDVRAQKKAVAHREKVTIETAAVVERATIEDRADERKARRARNLSIWGIIGGALGSGGIVAVVISALLGRC